MTVGVVIGETGAVVVDTRASVAQGVRLRDDLRELGVLDEPSVVNTHGHFDHCFGNAAFTGGPRWGHESVPEYLSRRSREMLAREFPEWAAKVETDVLVAPDRLVTSRNWIDLGDRTVELRHFGRGHTDGDLIVWVPDAECAFTGDLIEQSGPPAYGADSFPLEWPDTLAALLEALLLDTAGGVLVPGHGVPVDAAFATTQQEEIARVATLIREAHAAGMAVEEALRSSDWPYDSERLEQAVRRGYAAL